MISIGAIAALLCVAITTHLGAIQTLTYTREKGGVEISTTYTINKENDHYLIEGVAKDQTTKIESLVPYSLLSFVFTSKKNQDQYTLTLKDGVLTAEGQMKGVKLHAVYTIPKNSRWIQEFEFGLLPLLISKSKSIDFQILNPKDFKIHKMSAKKQGIETMKVGETSYQAQAVQISLQGFKSMFWKAQLWYDVDTHALLMYKANEGPHTPTTTTSLASKAAPIE